MPLFEDTAEDEIRRLRAIIAKMEEAKGVRVVTVEIVPKRGFGYLFYITAPTMASEEAFGMAMSNTIRQSFKVLGADLQQQIISGDHIAPPNGRMN
jgi:hypothetical protein